jgi:hypothetical protein
VVEHSCLITSDCHGMAWHGVRSLEYHLYTLSKEKRLMALLILACPYMHGRSMAKENRMQLPGSLCTSERHSERRRYMVGGCNSVPKAAPFVVTLCPGTLTVGRRRTRTRIRTRPKAEGGRTERMRRLRCVSLPSLVYSVLRVNLHCTALRCE